MLHSEPLRQEPSFTLAGTPLLTTVAQKHRGPCQPPAPGCVRVASQEGQEKAALCLSSRLPDALLSRVPCLCSKASGLCYNTPAGIYTWAGWAFSDFQDHTSWWREGESRRKLAVCQRRGGTHLTLPLGRWGGHMPCETPSASQTCCDSSRDPLPILGSSPCVSQQTNKNNLATPWAHRSPTERALAPASPK